jgi:hypothetical protein
MKLYKTTEKLTSENYPYGFRLKTTKTDYLEFNKSHGFRHCSYTINPKTGRENKPKKSTYYKILVLGRDESNNHVISQAFDFYGNDGFDKTINFLKVKENFDLFTSEQIEYIYQTLLVHIKANIGSQVVYCGSKLEDLKPLYDEAIGFAVKGIKDKGTVNYFDSIKFDWAKIDSYKVEGFSPFKTTVYNG